MASIHIYLDVKFNQHVTPS